MTTTITLYTKPGCVQCTATQRALDAAQVTYQAIDLTTSQAALERVRGLGYLQAPVVVDESAGSSWSGFQPARIDALRTAA